MVDYLKEYQEYYRVRMDRYLNDPDYAESYKSEKAIYEAITSCAELGDFKTKLGNLNELNAVALTKDEYKIRYDHYVSIQENVRALGPQRIVARCPEYNEVFNLMTMIGEEENKNMIEISMDSIAIFIDNWDQLDRIEIYENADVPSQYKKERLQRANEIKEKIREWYARDTEEMRKWQPDWTFNPELIWEERHRRLIPFSDEHIKEKMTQLKAILNLK